MGIRVLIGDPDLELLTVFQSYLTGHGFHVSATDNEQQCLRELCDFAPDVLVLELDGSRHWGERVIDAIRNRRDLPEVPVIAITQERRRNANEFPDGPIRACHVKPFSMTELISSIQEIVGSAA